jgi:hypothetical protein
VSVRAKTRSAEGPACKTGPDESFLNTETSDPIPRPSSSESTALRMQSIGFARCTRTIKNGAAVGHFRSGATTSVVSRPTSGVSTGGVEVHHGAGFAVRTIGRQQKEERERDQPGMHCTPTLENEHRYINAPLRGNLVARTNAADPKRALDWTVTGADSLSQNRASLDSPSANLIGVAQCAPLGHVRHSGAQSWLVSVSSYHSPSARLPAFP